MNILVTADMNWESKIDHALKVLKLGRVFEGRDYGSSVAGITIIFMCRDPAFKFKQRISYRKKERTLAMDIMLHLPEMIPLSHEGRRCVLAQRLLGEVPERLRKYKFTEFNYVAFESDWREAITVQLLGKDSARFDHLCKAQATF
jgi:hypothetical protein